jgi:hypothetical protein
MTSAPGLFQFVFKVDVGGGNKSMNTRTTLHQPAIPARASCSAGDTELPVTSRHWAATADSHEIAFWAQGNRR